MSDSTAWPEKRPSEWTQGERDRVRLLVYGGAPAPLDRTRLGMAIAETVPEANQRVTMNEWRKDLKRRVAERIAQRRRASQVCVVCDHGSRYPCEVCDPRGFALWLAERHL